MINAFITPTREEVYLKIEDLTVIEFLPQQTHLFFSSTIQLMRSKKKEEKPTLLHIVVGLR